VSYPAAWHGVLACHHWTLPFVSPQGLFVRSCDLAFMKLPVPRSFGLSCGLSCSGKSCGTIWTWSPDTVVCLLD